MKTDFLTCPYCSAVLPRRFRRSGACPHCLEHIYVRTVRDDKLIMTRLESWEVFGYPYIKRENLRGNPRHDLCVCRACGDVGSYMWLLYVDRFPLRCHSCEAFAVEIVDPDAVTPEIAKLLYRKAEQDDTM